MAFLHPPLSLPPPPNPTFPKYPLLLRNFNHNAVYSPSPSWTTRRNPLSVKCNDAKIPPDAGEDGNENQALKTVLKLYSYLIKNMGDSIIFMVRPTVEDGTTMGIKWKLGGSKLFAPLGKGFSIQSYHAIGGKLLIRNVEMVMEPLLQLHPMRLKTISAIASIVDQINMNWAPKKKWTRAASFAVGLFLLALALFFLQFSVR